MSKILLIGGSGQLGRKVISTFKSSYAISNIDFSQNTEAKTNYLLSNTAKTSQNNQNIINKLKTVHQKYKAIIVTAGGWTGGNIKDDDYFQKCQHMMNVNFYPSLLGAHLATKYLEENGIVILTGAAAVFRQPQPQMIAYSMAKTCVHSLALNLAEKAKQLNQRVITILPQTIDTQTNRQGMPTADFTKWAKPQHIGQLLKSWVDGLNLPNNGSYAILKVKNGCIIPQFV